MRGLWLVMLFVLAGCQREESGKKVREVPLGYRGMARVNPYLAAETYLREKGWPVESSRVWSEAGDETDLLVMPASFLQSSGMVRRALDWVAEGRSLVVTVQGGEPERNDFTAGGPGPLPEEAEFSGVDELLEALGIERVLYPSPGPNEEMEEEGHLSRPWETVRIQEDFGGYALEFEGSVGLQAPEGWDWTPKNGEGARMVGVSYGSGVVLVLAHARPFRNPYLARGDHAEFLEFLAEYYGGDRMVFLYGSSTSFFGLVWQEGKMAVIGGLILLACWLWMRIPRFGPILHDRAVRRAPYGESLTTSARFLWRTGQLNALFTPLRQRLRGEHGSPASGSEGDGPAPHDEGRSDDEPNEASIPSELPKDPGLILKTVQKLQKQLKP